MQEDRLSGRCRSVPSGARGSLVIVGAGRVVTLVVLLVASTTACSRSSGESGAANDGLGVAATSTVPPSAGATKAPAPTSPSSTTSTSIGRPRAAADPVALGTQIRLAEGTIRDADTTPIALAAAARTQQVAYRALVLHPEWDAQVAAGLPSELRTVMEANVTAGRELRQLVRKPKDTLPAWRIVEPEPIDVLRKAYEAGEAAYGVPWEYLAAVNLTETRMGRIRGVSTAGARGPMQFLPSTWEAYGQGDIENTQDAIVAAARYLAANGAPERMADALYRYNPTPRYVHAVRAYATQMEADERAFQAYYHWEVYYATTLGDVLLPVGFSLAEPRPVTQADL